MNYLLVVKVIWSVNYLIKKIMYQKLPLYKLEILKYWKLVSGICGWNFVPIYGFEILKYLKFVSGTCGWKLDMDK